MSELSEDVQSVFDASIRDFHRITDQLCQHPFYRASNFRSTLSVPVKFRRRNGFSGKGRISYNRETRNILIRFSVGFNVLKALRNRLSCKQLSPISLSLDSNTNFIPPDIIESLGQKNISQLSIETMVEQIILLQAIITNAIGNNVGGNPIRLGLPLISIEQIELGVDIPCDNSLLLIRKLEKPIKQHFDNLRKRKYILDEFTQANSFGLSIQTASNERLKIYAKTHKSLRVEFEFKKNRIQYILGTNRIIEQSTNWLRDSFDRLLTKARGSIQRLDLTINAKYDDKLNYINCAYNFLRLCGDFKTFYLIASILIATGRIRFRGDLSYPLRKLLRSGFLHKGERGVYICQPQLVDTLARFIQELTKNPVDVN